RRRRRGSARSDAGDGARPRRRAARDGAPGTASLMEILTPQQPWPSILLARAGRYDPDANDAFQAARAAGAWGAWEDNAGRMSPDSLIRAVADAGLRGRGGGGFPTGRKWYACATTQSPVHYAVG